MSDSKNGKGRRARRRLAVVCIWVVAIAWSLYLVAEEVNGEGGTFPIIVQVMGSAGILYALFLVSRPRRRGVLEVFGFFREIAAAEEDEEPREASNAAARWSLITITLALAIGGLAYRLSLDSALHQSAAFFIGVPTVLAITLALTPKAKSATGMIVKGLTLALLLSGVVFYEGFVCVLMAAPLFYLVGIVIGAPLDRAGRRKKPQGRIYSIVGATLLLLSVEGVIPETSLPERESVVVTRTIDAPADAVAESLSRTPSFEEPLPFYLQLGFPRPVSAHGSGLRVGDHRMIVFGNQSPMEPVGTSGHHHESSPDNDGGVLEMKIVQSGEGRVVFEPVQDATAFTHWIEWGRSVVEWESTGPSSTEVTWTLQFERKLSPAWYFGPWQRYAAKLAAGHLIDSLMTP